MTRHIVYCGNPKDVETKDFTKVDYLVQLIKCHEWQKANGCVDANLEALIESVRTELNEGR